MTLKKTLYFPLSCQYFVKYLLDTPTAIYYFNHVTFIKICLLWTLHARLQYSWEMLFKVQITLTNMSFHLT